MTIVAITTTSRTTVPAPHRPTPVTDPDARLPLPVVLLAAVAGLSCVVLIDQAAEITTTALVVGGLGLAVLLLGAPVGVVRGAALVAAVSVGYVVAPNNGPHHTQYVGIAVVLAILVAAAVRTVGQDRRTKVALAGLVWAGAYFGLFVVSTALGAAATSATDLLFAVVAPGLLVVLLGRHFSSADLRVFVRGLLGLALLQIVASVIDLFVRPLPFLGYWYYKRSDNELLGSLIPRAQGLAGHPILLSTVVGFALLLNWRNLGQLRRGTHLALTVVLLAGFALSGTRSGLVALLVALGSLVIVNARTANRRARNIVFVLAAVVVVLANQALVGTITDRIRSLGQSGSYYHRAAAITGLPELLASRDLRTLLLGTGRGSELRVFGAGFLQQDGLTVIDNQLITTLVVGGLVGLVALAVLVIRALVRSPAPLRAALLFGVVMFNSFDILRWVGPSLVIMLLIALADDPRFATGRRPQVSEPAGRPTHR